MTRQPTPHPRRGRSGPRRDDPRVAAWILRATAENPDAPVPILAHRIGAPLWAVRQARRILEREP